MIKYVKKITDQRFLRYGGTVQEANNVKLVLPNVKSLYAGVTSSE